MNILFSCAVIIPVFVVFLKLVFITSSIQDLGEKSLVILRYFTMFRFELLTLLLLVVFIGAMSIYINKVILDPLYILKESARQIREGSAPSGLNKLKKGEFGEIAGTVNDLVASLDEKHRELEDMAFKLVKKDVAIRESEIKLNAICSQVQVIMEELKEAEERCRYLEAKVPEIACVVDRFGTICIVNHICPDFLGYSRPDIVGLNVASLVDLKASPFSIEAILSDLKQKDSVSLPLSLVGKNGSRFNGEAIFSAYRSNAVNVGLQLIIRNAARKDFAGSSQTQADNSLSAFYSVSKSFNSSNDIEMLSRSIVDEIGLKLGFPICMLGLLDRSGTNLRVKACSGSYLETCKSDLLDMAGTYLDACMMERTFISSERFSEEDMRDNWFISRVNKNRPEEEWVRELLYVPVNGNSRKIGLLIVGFKDAIRPYDVNLICSIANSAAVAIENAILYGDCRRYFGKMIDTLVAAIEAKDRYTKGHSQRVSNYTVRIAQKLKLSDDQVEDLRMAGILHDVGKIGINDNILLKPGRLTRNEYDEVKRHPAISNRILNHAGFSERTLKAVAHHHERYDGKGYPFGLSGRNITLGAQIIAVADAYDAMTSDRPHRKAMNMDEAFRELIANRKTQFSPEIVDVMVDIRDSLKAIRFKS